MVKYKCPVCGFTADSKHAIQGHILGSSDPQHKELRGPGLWEKIITVDDEGSEVISITNSEDSELLELADKITLDQIHQYIQEISILKSELDKLKRRVDVHKQVLLKILKSLGVE